MLRLSVIQCRGQGMHLSVIPYGDQGMCLLAIPRRDQRKRRSVIPYGDHSRRTSRQNSRELRNIIHLMGLTGIMPIPRNTSLTGRA